MIITAKSILGQYYDVINKEGQRVCYVSYANEESQELLLYKSDENGEIMYDTENKKPFYNKVTDMKFSIIRKASYAYIVVDVLKRYLRREL